MAISPYHPITILGFGFSSALLVLGSVSPEIESFFRKHHVLRLIGDASYSIYLVHLWALNASFNLVRSLMERTFNITLDDGMGQSLLISDLLLVFIVALSVLFGILIHLKVERPLLHFLRKKMHAAKS